MEVLVKEPSQCERVLEISLPPEPVKEKIDELYRKYQQELSMPGFRKGKVPMNVIKGRFEAAIQEEAINATIREAFKEAIKEKELSPISQGVIKDTKFSNEDGLFFKATFEIIPPVSPENYKGIEVQFPSTQVSKEEIEVQISKLQDSRATYIPLLRRSALPGDMLIVDYEILLEERGIIRRNKVSNYTILLDDPRVPEEITDALINSLPGDRRKASLRYPTDYEDPKLRGQWVEYEFLVREVKEKKLPPVDDEFAKGFGFNSLEELEEQIGKELKKEKEMVSRVKVETQIINSLIEGNPFEPPISIVRAYLEPLLRKAGKEVDEKIRKNLEEIAVWRGKREILLNKIAEIEKIELTDDEIKSKIMGIEEYKRMGYESAVRTLKEKGVFEFLMAEFRREKTLDFLVNYTKGERW